MAKAYHKRGILQTGAIDGFAVPWYHEAVFCGHGGMADTKDLKSFASACGFNSRCPHQENPYAKSIAGRWIFIFKERRSEQRTGKEAFMRYNVIVLFNADETRVLMCQRRKAPYKGKLNFVGGKVKPGETSLAAAYRELREETAVLPQNVTLSHIMDITYTLEDGVLEVYSGTLTSDVPVNGTENELLWVDLREDFSDTARFAGCGNIYHMLCYLRTYSQQITAAGKVQPE
jgi:8-oxo-dGTP diphosphatase